MIRNLKALGLAVVAVLAMSAVVASAASATTATFTAESFPVIGTSNQVSPPGDSLTVGNGARVVTCSTSKYDTTLKAAATEITLTPTYSGCTSTGGLPVTVTTNGCDIDLTGTTVTETTGTAAAKFTCPAGVTLKVDVYASAAKHTENVRSCEYEIAPQTVASAGEYHNIGAGTTREIELTMKATVVTKNLVGSKLLCGIAAGETGNSTLAGTQRLTGEKEEGGAHVGLFVSP